MSARHKTLGQLKGEQAAASDPFAHAALAASAGTGKTHVLTARVLRLLLSGVRPESILCLTFTKAAAAEMANRIGDRLAKWVRLKRAELWSDLEALGERPDDALIETARQLFARVLDCPGGLRIQTIHAFAQALLTAFPAEADVPPGFQPIEGRAEQELVRRTLADLMSDAEARGDDALIQDVQCLSRRLGEAGAVEYLQACARRGDAMAGLGPPPDIEQLVREHMKLPDGSVEDYLAHHCGDEGFDCDLLHAIAEANRNWGTSSGAKIVETIERWLAMEPRLRSAALPELASIVFTAKGELKVVTKGQSNADPDYERHAQALAECVGGLLQVQRASRLASDIAAGLRAGQAFAQAYAVAKRDAGVADFNDLIEWTRRLLRQDGIGEWVRYKLDRRADHVLIDEAQDTNAAQWEIIRVLVEEFFTGSSESEHRHRTLFMVGDFKQAIYGFQGSDPQSFHDARADFRRRAEALSEAERETEEQERRALEFRDLSIAASFRSAQGVLDLVDSVIETVGHEALALSEAPRRHIAHHRDRPGEVELWKAFEIEDGVDESDEGEERWVSIRDRRYAEALADRIRALIDEAPLLASTGRSLTPGDILVLVRSRGELASLVVTRLFAAGIPVAGVDRLHLHEPIAVQDLLAAIKFAVQPDDDLSLACLLVSPLIGWDQDQLRDLAYGRDKVPLWRKLRERAGEAEHVRLAHDGLADLLRIADYVTPSQFLQTILTGPMDGRRRLYSRLGVAARDAIDELMNSALEFERNEIASLDRFLSWFSRGSVDVQRDPGQPLNEVRVMTVHGAKGLEAPVVILADATADPARLGRTPITVDLELGPGLTPLLRPKRDERCAPFEEIILAEEQRDREEHMRLLYVALTRAADRLIISGVMPKSKKDGSDPRAAQSWHVIVEQALARLGAKPAERAWGAGLVYRSGPTAKAKRAKANSEVQPLAVPAWARAPAPKEERPPRPLAPSAMAVDDDTALPPSEALRDAARRGTLIHSLLERLPEVAESQRREIALGWLERSAGVSDAGIREEIADRVCSIIANPDFESLFGPRSFGEAPLAAALADGRVIAGTVDRLLVEAGRVSVIDFKTGRVPATARDIPASHSAQMAAYAEALAVIFPGKAIRSALLYTAGPRLFDLSSA